MQLPFLIMMLSALLPLETQYIPHGRKLYVVQQKSYFCFHPVQVQIVPETGLQPCTDSRLVRINFPWVEINDCRLSLTNIYIIYCTTYQWGRKEPQVSAARNRHTIMPPPYLQGKSGNREFFNISSLRYNIMDEPFSARDSVYVMDYGKNAGIVRESFLGQYIERPQRFAGYGITRCPITVNLFPADVFQNGFGPVHILSKLIRSDPIDQFMAITMAGNLMASTINLPNKVRAPFSHPAEDEKGRLDPELVQHVENAGGVPLNTQGVMIPLVTADVPLEGGYLEIIFDIYG